MSDDLAYDTGWCTFGSVKSNKWQTKLLCLLFLVFFLQCRPSKGRRRGYCWCVDKYGQPLPGYDGRQWGEKQCYNLESKWEDGGTKSGWKGEDGVIWGRDGRGGEGGEKERDPTVLLHLVLCKHLKELWTSDFRSCFCWREGRGD